MADLFTLSGPDEEIRSFWIDHGKACTRVAKFCMKYAAAKGILYLMDNFKDLSDAFKLNLDESFISDK
ncbi:MAG TPA: L-rhamnose isomerase [Bacillota bacterium]|nr:L-rhamnose isomerase [Bacillota bacterium]